ncbi:exonuclease V, chloroplastic-like [Macadamia integrifolia]|uniref:exonuclease V, chloroplastic-like n=1 Tax=Macadamia integrifolia TaxID=60698 RepID=UPI001C4EB530|nr:exonuclease V, chloroplastic-like [Macadamia integrifolia]
MNPSDHIIDSPIKSSPYNVPEIPIEIVSEEEMALIEAAFTATRSSLPSSFISSSASSSSSQSRLSLFSSVSSISFHSKRRLSGCSEGNTVRDIEDSGATQKKSIVPQSLLDRFRRRRGLAITDLTASEWCEKQMEFTLLYGKPRRTKAMKAGSDRHTKLEEEVIKKIKVQVKAVEDAWGLKLMNFIVGSNQLLFEGLTRELPLVGLVDGVWMVGAIDELRMPLTEEIRTPSLVDTKTRVKATLPSEPQQRNGRLQLMCYKYLWDNIVADSFPADRFFDFFGLNPHHVLSEDIIEHATSSGFPVKTLEDLVTCFRNACCLLPPAHDQLLLRYELQGDHSLLGEDQFAYESDWLKSQIQCCLEFWMGNREARYVPAEERWKCRICKFASVCPTNTSTNSSSS